ncbi:hypothetical protein GF327_07335 [Candidatus Woesearchaeota archaeon]|nr:hypothetical protein [Candidatus Woesearchaeota archaeon]
MQKYDDYASILIGNDPTNDQSYDPLQVLECRVYGTDPDSLSLISFLEGLRVQAKWDEDRRTIEGINRITFFGEYRVPQFGSPILVLDAVSYSNITKSHSVKRNRKIGFVVSDEEPQTITIEKRTLNDHNYDELDSLREIHSPEQEGRLIKINTRVKSLYQQGRDICAILADDPFTESSPVSEATVLLTDGNYSLDVLNILGYASRSRYVNTSRKQVKDYSEEITVYGQIRDGRIIVHGAQLVNHLAVYNPESKSISFQREHNLQYFLMNLVDKPTG